MFQSMMNSRNRNSSSISGVGGAAGAGIGTLAGDLFGSGNNNNTVSAQPVQNNQSNLGDLKPYHQQAEQMMRPEFDQQMQQLGNQQVSRGFYGQLPSDVMSQQLAGQQQSQIMQQALGLQDQSRQRDFQQQQIDQRGREVDMQQDAHDIEKRRSAFSNIGTGASIGGMVGGVPGAVAGGIVGAGASLLGGLFS